MRLVLAMCNVSLILVLPRRHSDLTQTPLTMIFVLSLSQSQGSLDPNNIVDYVRGNVAMMSYAELRVEGTLLTF